ncbi:dual specificity protein kinase kns1, partial [Podila epicladia]
MATTATAAGKRPDWSDYYRNGAPREIIIIDDDSPPPQLPSLSAGSTSSTGSYHHHPYPHQNQNHHYHQQQHQQQQQYSQQQQYQSKHQQHRLPPQRQPSPYHQHQHQHQKLLQQPYQEPNHSSSRYNQHNTHQSPNQQAHYSHNQQNHYHEGPHHYDEELSPRSVMPPPHPSHYPSSVASIPNQNHGPGLGGLGPGEGQARRSNKRLPSADLDYSITSGGGDLSYSTSALSSSNTGFQFPPPIPHQRPSYSGHPTYSYSQHPRTQYDDPVPSPSLNHTAHQSESEHHPQQYHPHLDRQQQQQQQQQHNGPPPPPQYHPGYSYYSGPPSPVFPPSYSHIPLPTSSAVFDHSRAYDPVEVPPMKRKRRSIVDAKYFSGGPPPPTHPSPHHQPYGTGHHTQHHHQNQHHYHHQPYPLQHPREELPVLYPPPNLPSATNVVSGTACEPTSTPWDDKEGHYIVVPNQDLIKRYKILRLLGQGTFGKVVECFDRETGQHCAIKIIRAVQKYRDASKTEIRVLATMKAYDPENKFKCLHLREWFDHRNHVCMVFELLGQSIYDWLKDNTFCPFPPNQIQQFAKQLLTSVAFLHRLRLIHTDLKPENILLANGDFRMATYKGKPGIKMRRILKNPDIRLIDFGSATFEEDHHSSVVSTRHYRAPEIILGLGWSYPCDIWSVGCILIEFLTGEALFQTHDNLEHLAMMQSVLGPMPGKLIRASPLAYPNDETKKTSRKFVKALRPLR